MSEQYPLAIALSQTATLATWVPGDNGALMHQLYALLDGRERHSLTVYGPEGAGKSHLLQACCQAVFERNGKALYFSLDEVVRAPSRNITATVGILLITTAVIAAVSTKPIHM